MLNTTVDREALHAAMQIIKRAAEKKYCIPILSHCLLTADDGALSIVATDLDMETRVTVPARTVAPGRATLPARLLADLVKGLPKGAAITLAEAEGKARRVETGRTKENKPIYREYQDPRVKLSCGAGASTLDGIHVDDFPNPVGSTPLEGRAFKPAEFDHAFTIEAPALLRLLNATAFAISTEETRYYLNGVYLHAADGALRAVTTDGHRLASSETRLPGGADKISGMILPRRAVVEIQKLLAKEKGPVSINCSIAKIRFAAARWTLTTKLIDGSFPDYRRVIPRGNNNVLRVDKAPFAELVKRVSAMSTARGRAFKLTLSAGEAAASVVNPDAGETRGAIPADFNGPDGFETGFNADYVLSILAAMGEEDGTIVLRFGGPSDPCLIQARRTDPELFVLMPLRV